MVSHLDPFHVLASLWRNVRASIAQGIGPSGDDELDDEVAMATKVECDKGWLVGPFTEVELDRRLGPLLPAPRFGIRQGHEGSVRVIDDYSVQATMEPPPFPRKLTLAVLTSSLASRVHVLGSSLERTMVPQGGNNWTCK